MTHRLSLPSAVSALSFGLLVLFLAFAKPAAAQSVEGISEIVPDWTTSSQIVTYSATELDYDAALYYDAYVEGYLYQNSSLIADGAAYGQSCAADPNIPCDANFVWRADGYFQMPLYVGDDYIIESDHYVVAFFAYEEGGGEITIPILTSTSLERTMVPTPATVTMTAVAARRIPLTSTSTLALQASRCPAPRLRSLA
ncbi:MAG: hypothetical protein ACLQGV_16145 [Bryobacteraceae bacterium]